MLRVYEDDEGLTPTGRVPAEHRHFGLDRRTLGPALFVIAVALIWLLLVPGANSLLDYDETTEAGDVFVLSTGLTMKAEEGWGIDSGLRTTDETRGPNLGGTVSLFKGSVSFQVQPGPYSGDLETLLEGIKKTTSATQGSEAFNVVAGDRETFTTDDGVTGIAEGYTTIGGEGVVAALVFPDTGLEITASGPEPDIAPASDEIQDMIESISYDKATAGQ